MEYQQYNPGTNPGTTPAPVFVAKTNEPPGAVFEIFFNIGLRDSGMRIELTSARFFLGGQTLAEKSPNLHLIIAKRPRRYPHVSGSVHKPPQNAGCAPATAYGPCGAVDCPHQHKL